MRVARMARLKLPKQIERPRGLLLVPDIDEMELVVGFAPQQLSGLARSEHLLEPAGAVATREQQEPAQHLEHAGADIRVVAVQAQPEVGIGQPGVERDGAFERLPDAPAVASGGQVMAAKHLPLDPGRVRAAEVEPGLGALRFTPGPRARRGNRGLDLRPERGVAGGVVRVDPNAPPDRHRIQYLAGFGRSRRTRRGPQRRHLVEARVKDGVVDACELRCAGEAAHGRIRFLSWKWKYRNDRHENHRGTEAPGRNAKCARCLGVSVVSSHVMLVRSCCFSACRSRASAMRRSRSAG
ncbi:MAG: hypothetical protein A3F70_02020 [Acidobacteria bacterium RIFCSPLOWO2_12_FULL_67_14]|nr:MAG: hypothetical protein A3F70_02020 [Acidobacteria bacterium RIFCSPLOWO2_12_FULL_67_14]